MGHVLAGKGWIYRYPGHGVDEITRTVSGVLAALAKLAEAEMSEEVKKLIEYAEENGVQFSNYDLGWITAKKGKRVMAIDLLGDTQDVWRKLDWLISAGAEEQA